MHRGKSKTETTPLALVALPECPLCDLSLHFAEIQELWASRQYFALYLAQGWCNFQIVPHRVIRHTASSGPISPDRAPPRTFTQKQIKQTSLIIPPLS